MASISSDETLQEKWDELPSANYDEWSNTPVWSLREFAYLLKGKEPINELWSFELQEFDDHYKKLEKLTLRWEKGGMLIPMHKSWDGEMPINREYHAYDLLKFAESYGYEINKNLKPIHSKNSEDLGQSKWRYIHDTKLLQIARKIIDENWEGKDPKDAPSKEAILLGLKEEYPNMSDGEAKAIDMITRHDKRRVTKL